MEGLGALLPLAIWLQNSPDPGTISGPVEQVVTTRGSGTAGHTSPSPPSVGVESRRVVPEANGEQTAPRNQAAWQLTGGARSLMTPG